MKLLRNSIRVFSFLALLLPIIFIFPIGSEMSVIIVIIIGMVSYLVLAILYIKYYFKTKYSLLTLICSIILLLVASLHLFLAPHSDLFFEFFYYIDILAVIMLLVLFINSLFLKVKNVKTD